MNLQSRDSSSGIRITRIFHHFLILKKEMEALKLRNPDYTEYVRVCDCSHWLVKWLTSATGFVTWFHRGLALPVTKS